MYERESKNPANKRNLEIIKYLRYMSNWPFRCWIWLVHHRQYRATGARCNCIIIWCTLFTKEIWRRIIMCVHFWEFGCRKRHSYGRKLYTGCQLRDGLLGRSSRLHARNRVPVDKAAYTHETATAARLHARNRVQDALEEGHSSGTIWRIYHLCSFLLSYTVLDIHNG